MKNILKPSESFTVDFKLSERIILYKLMDSKATLDKILDVEKVGIGQQPSYNDTNCKVSVQTSYPIGPIYFSESSSDEERGRTPSGTQVSASVKQIKKLLN